MCPLYFIVQDQTSAQKGQSSVGKLYLWRGALRLPTCNRTLLTCAQVLALEMSSWAGGLLHFPLAFSLKFAYSVFPPSEWHFVTTCVIWSYLWFGWPSDPFRHYILKPMGNHVLLGHPSEEPGFIRRKCRCKMTLRWHLWISLGQPDNVSYAFQLQVSS